jgi:Acetyltransferase (GNAT) domain
LTWTDSWASQDLAALEEASKLSSFAMDPAWAEAASSSGYATPVRLGLEAGGTLEAAVLGLRRVRMGVAKVVCGSNGGVGILAINMPAGARLLEEIRRRWHPSVLQVFAHKALPTRSVAWEPSFTIHLDLRPPLERIQARFDKSTRKSLARATRRGVTAEVVESTADRDRAFALLRQTASSKRFVLPARTYLNAVHAAFQKTGLSEIVVALRKEELLAVVHVIGARGLATWWKGGASEGGYRLNASLVAHWRAIELVKEAGYENYDLGGTHPSDPAYASIHRFKSGFGGTLVETSVGVHSSPVGRALSRLRSV